MGRRHSTESGSGTESGRALTKRTPEIDTLLKKQADLRAQILPYKDLERLTGISQKYIANIISRMVRRKCELSIVSPETIDSHNRES